MTDQQRRFLPTGDIGSVSDRTTVRPDSELYVWMHKHYGRLMGAGLLEVLERGGRFADYLRRSISREIDSGAPS